MLQYQGRLTNPSTGQPVADDTYAVTFNLYTDSSGPVVWTETKNVSVAGGLFSTLVGDITPLPQSLLNGQELWLGIKVRDDPEAIPRQTIFPVAYAMSLRPGAIINGSVSGAPILQATNSYTTGVNYGVYGASASTSGGSGVYGTSPYVGVWGYATGSTGRWGGYFQSAAPTGLGVMGVASDGTGVNYGVYGSTSSPNGYAGYFVGDVRVSGDVTIAGDLNAPRTRYVPITAGDLMHSMADTVYTGDCCNGVLFPDGSQSGGPITFPLPDDYVPGTNLSLDLYLIPLDSGSGAIAFWVRFVGLTTGGWSGTGGSVNSTAVPLGNPNYVHKQSFTLPGFAAGSLPELAELTIRREPSDTYAGRVALIGLRLAYQASR
jgi:hypothetical protein